MFGRRKRPVRREQELASLDLQGQRITYLLKRSSARRSLALRVNAQGQAQVNAPIAMPSYRIEAFLIQHADWLQAQIARSREGFVWADGSVLPYLGGWLRLEWASDSAVTEHATGRLRCLPGSGETEVLDWYRRQAAHVLAGRLSDICKRSGLPVPEWRLSDARTRWGSLSPQGRVSLNWRLVKAGTEVIDYVICHELAHFRHRNHSAAFWREVGRLCPDFERARAALRESEVVYFAF